MVYGASKNWVSFLKFISFCLFLTIVSCGGGSTPSTNASTNIGVNNGTAAAGVNGGVTTSYQESKENFANPERGFAYENDVAWAPEPLAWDFCGQGNNFTAYNYTAWNDQLKLDFLLKERAQGRSVVASRYHIADFRNRAITQEYLDFLQKDFDTVRQAGVKMSIRFAYNYPNGGPDAPLERIKGHLDQLQVLLRKNMDVIAYTTAGFVGCWGEWHNSSNGLTTPEGITSAQKQIMDKWLEVLPADRMVVMRYPFHKFGYFGNDVDYKPIAPLTPETAFNGSKRSRVGLTDDCPVCSESHGTGYWNPRKDLTEAANFIKQENLYVIQTGEAGTPGAIDPKDPVDAQSPLSACSRMLDEFKNGRWNVMEMFDVNARTSAYKRWERDGCLEEMKQRLGYRYRMSQSDIAPSAPAGGTLSMSLVVTNDGWANLYNPRKLEIILRAKVGGAVYPLTVYNDARLKMPQPAETKTLDLSSVLPANLPAGQYEVLLNLPDPTATLYSRPEYSIRLANKDLWEPSTGFNKLLTEVAITR